ncbi:MAG: carbohydrate-binding family 9-like protein [Candidatus Sumerlaeales bacterium]|nr:carbohydrate-binding family 9-like protein [Candidatus Sumerlaeales bacterium]
MKRYDVKQVAKFLSKEALGWDSHQWLNIPILKVDEFHPSGSNHKPDVSVKLFHTNDCVHILFRVQDRYVRAIRIGRQNPVCLDSCVEFFAWPKNDSGYVNLEMNCGGAFLSKYYKNPDADPEELHRTACPLNNTVLDNVVIRTTMPQTVDPEIEEWTTYYVQASIPVSVYESVVGCIGLLQGQIWRANFYKCGDETSHPHWGSWNSIGKELNFHQPHKFGEIRFL